MNIEQFFARLKAAAEALSGKQLGSLSVAFVAAVSLTIGSAYWLNTPNYGVLFSDMDSESASSVITKLKADKIAYAIGDGGKTIRVPETRVDELRLQFASQGMPGSGHVGFEIFDKTAFGVTDFLEHVNYRRALEGELARTISTISEVAGARSADQGVCHSEAAQQSAAVSVHRRSDYRPCVSERGIVEAGGDRHHRQLRQAAVADRRPGRSGRRRRH